MKMTRYCLSILDDIFTGNYHELEILKSKGCFSEYKNLIYGKILERFTLDESRGLAILRNDGSGARGGDVLARCKVVLYWIMTRDSVRCVGYRRAWKVPRKVIAELIQDCVDWHDVYYEVRI